MFPLKINIVNCDMFSINNKTGMLRISKCIYGLEALRNIKYSTRICEGVEILSFDIKGNNFGYKKSGSVIENIFSRIFSNAVSINLSDNNLKSQSVKNIIAVMKICKGLVVIRLCENCFNRNDKLRLSKAAKKYPNLSLVF